MVIRMNVAVEKALYDLFAYMVGVLGTGKVRIES